MRNLGSIVLAASILLTALPGGQAVTTYSLGDPFAPLTTAEQTFASRHLAAGKPQALFERVREGYVAGIDPMLKIPRWVQYEVSVSELNGIGDRDLSSWASDLTLPDQGRATDDDYTGSGFDRGHMAPAEDMTRSQPVMNESHIFNNAIPQIGSQFNSSKWRSLEGRIRNWLDERPTLTVIAGPVFFVDETNTDFDAGADDEEPTGTVSYSVIGTGHVAVPTGFFKIVADLSNPAEPEVIAFLFPHRDVTGTENPLVEFLESVDEIERLTGLDFLSALPDDLEIEIEKEPATELWEAA